MTLTAVDPQLMMSALGCWWINSWERASRNQSYVEITEGVVPDIEDMSDLDRRLEIASLTTYNLSIENTDQPVYFLNVRD